LREHRFSRSPLAKWENFRDALADWPEAKARHYFDLLREKEDLHPGKYKYAHWDKAARAWNRKSPDEWKGRASAAAAHRTSRATDAGEAVKKELTRKK